MHDAPHWNFPRYFVPFLLSAALLWLSYAVLHEFFLVIAWAIILAYVIWPSYQLLKRKLNGRATLSAFIMTGAIAFFILVAAFWLINALQKEATVIYQQLTTDFSSLPRQATHAIEGIPWLNTILQPYLDMLSADVGDFKGPILDWAKQGLQHTINLLGGVGKKILTICFILITLFFCFRDGEAAIAQLRRGFHHILGENQTAYIQAAGDTTKAVVYGLVLASFGQGLLAGVGYAVSGVNAPTLLGAVTALFSLVPMGAPLIWMPVSLSLLAAGHLWQGLGLMLWGFLAISTIDNIIRPLVISGAGRIPFLVVLFGVFGGLRAFGFIGLFIGPVILSVLLAVWQAWLKQQNPNAD